MIAVRMALGLALLASALGACGDDSPSTPAPESLVYREGNGLLPDEYPRIVLANADGTGRKILCDSCPDRPASSPLYPSPDGSVILFQSDNTSATVWMTVSRNGGGAVPFPTGVSWHWPAWAPGGRSIAWTVIADGLSRIGIASPRSTSAIIITPDSLQVTSVAWSPDGSRLAFTGANAGDDNAYTVRSDGTDLRVVSAIAGVADRAPMWSPTGDSLAYIRSGSTVPEQDGIWMSASAGGPARMVTQGRFAGAPYFSPDGSALLVLANRGSYYRPARIAVASGEQLSIPALGATFTTTPWSAKGDLIVTFTWPAYSVPPSIDTSPSEGTPKVRINPDTTSGSRAAWLPPAR
jgi:TolB protein